MTQVRVPAGQEQRPALDSIRLAQPRLRIALTGGLNDATVNDATGTVFAFPGAASTPGHGTQVSNVGTHADVIRRFSMDRR
jgi:hypothetical protein